MPDVPLLKSPMALSDLQGASTATSGQVPTADGAGGVAWGDQSGGGGGGGGLATPISIDVFMGASANTNWSTIAADSAGIHCGYRLSSSAINASVSFEAYLGVGTWEIDIMYAKGNNMGIITVAVDGATEGTVDAYDSAGSRNHIATITPVDVTTAGIKTIKLTMASKNASSSNYYGQIQAIKVRRPLV